MTGINNWEYAQWTISIGRSLRLNPPHNPSAELTMCQEFYSYIYSQRPWLKDNFLGNSEEMQGLVTTDNPQVLGKQIEVIGRDMMKIQVQDFSEKLYVDLLVGATGNRRFGAQGARSSSSVTVV
jgi:hypothetical protein